MATKQWVNLPTLDEGALKRSTYVGGSVSSVDVMGREVFIEVEFDKKDANSLATLEVTPDGGNVAYKDTESAYRADTKSTAKISTEGKARFEVKLSVSGGDKFKFTARDAKGGKKELATELETARKLYYQVIEMEEITGLSDYSFWVTEFNKGHRAIELETISSNGKIEHVYNFGDHEIDKLFNLAKNKYSAAKDPYCFAVVVADSLADGPKDRQYESDPTKPVTKGSGLVKIPIPTSYQLWKDIDKSAKAKNWKRRVFYKYKMKDGSTGTVDIKDEDIKSDYYSITVDTKNLIDGAGGQIIAQVRVAESFAGGWSFPSFNIIVIAHRGREDKSFPTTTIQKIVIHEAGHKIGMVPTGATIEKQSSFDNANPPHCTDQACVMWWTLSSSSNNYCADCDKSIIKMPLYAPTLPGFTRFY